MDGLYIRRDIPAASLDLQTGKTLSGLFQGKFSGFIRRIYTRGVVRRYPVGSGSAQKPANRFSVVFSLKIPQRNIKRGFCITVTVECVIHNRARKVNIQSVRTDKIRRHFLESCPRSPGMVGLIDRSDRTAFAPSCKATVGNDPYNR